MSSNILLSLVFFFCLGQIKAQPPQKVIDRVVTTINEIRNDGCKCGKKYMQPVGPITWSDHLYYTASSHAEDMLENNYFGHISKDGRDVGDRFDDLGYNWQYAGENLGEGQDSFEEVVRDWLQSPSHCKMIMNADMKEMGLSKRGRFWVQHFGTTMPPNYRRTKTRYSEGNE